jgi:hypothetical protein
MVVIQIHVGKNLVEDVSLDGWFKVNIITNDLLKKLGLPTPRLTLYTLRMVDHTLTKVVGLIKDLKIHIHGIPYIVTFLIMDNKVLETNYSMLLGCPWLCKTKITYDWGNNLITTKWNAIIWTITIAKHLDMNTKCMEMLICYDFMSMV